MYEIITNFQTKSGLVGPSRTKVLQKVLAASIAYTAPCFAGDVKEGTSFYNSMVMGTALTIVSEVNERCLVNTDEVMEDVRTLWMGRYNAINNPIHNENLERFQASLSTIGDGMMPHYELWLGHFYKATQTKLARMNGAS